MADEPVVAVLGTGIMGAAMARNLRASGLTVRVWNRSQDKLAPLVAEGATAAQTPAEAVRGADVVLTMLADGPTVADAMTDALPAMADGAVWAQAATVGIAHTERLATMAAERGVSYVDAPVLGTKQPAEEGKLVVLESGDPAACARCAAVFAAVGARTVHVADWPGAGSRLKLVANNWVLALVGATAETVALAGALGVDPQNFLDAIAGGPLDVAYAHLKSAAMTSGEYPPSFPLTLAAKDARLVLEAGEGVNLTGTRALLGHLEGAERRGHGAEDMAALFHDVRGD